MELPVSYVLIKIEMCLPFIKDFKIIVFVLYNRVQASSVDATTTTASATGKVIYSLR